MEVSHRGQPYKARPLDCPEGWGGRGTKKMEPSDWESTVSSESFILVFMLCELFCHLAKWERALLSPSQFLIENRKA